MTTVNTEKVLQEIEVLIRARYPIIYIVSWEETRVVNWLVKLAAKRDKRLFEWSFSSGLVENTNQRQRPKSNNTKDPVNAFEEVMGHVEPAIYIFKDLHPFLTKNNFAVIRKLKDTAIHIKETYKTLILVSPVLEVPPELEKETTVIDFPLPDEADIGRLLDQIVHDVQMSPNSEKVVIDIPPAAREQLLKAALGLTLGEAENVLAKTLVSDGRLTESDITSVFAEKKQIIRKSGLLDYYDVDVNFDGVGGLESLKDWLRTRALAFTDRARDYGLPPPKGVLLLGVQGCGKSMCAKAVSGLWKMPLLRLDVGRMFGSLVGSSEDNMRRALSTAESIAPVVLWLDEIDKAMAGSRSSGSSDSGVTARVFGTFLTWLSEKTSTVFVVATANDISNLPPELMRKGRFDEIFFVDLPSDSERQQIFAVRLKERARNADEFDLPRLAEASAGFSGAEIDEAIVSGLYDSFATGETFSTEHIEKAVRETVPLSKTMEADLERLRSWADGRARPASPREESLPSEQRRKIEIN
ncbi:ATPase [candidate division BRC1 bacterium HGW-BRC1-1]|jgi:SpoVK/Ycf46/Vps4 family AAA+-type ATPase|nr:MAG: ATPase [candidate division BRC1 bacterium HGW-BRC1-1]